ncbi:hypothetical protein [Methanothermococcus okinawensis]|uniref:Transcriptional regulator PadR family protein n=1 Tax=Methanothermococcus okinawensis (strain DSM 14208 / JCM 11175 / IH1) TaxID=647113 RepID=F8AKS4_METOI|nr:hypothetical protein [Methanothermococcus okinawensis]AEH06416.1 hypothetical protein Metok_0432 [Methanothermococcus okinawensis IH1]
MPKKSHNKLELMENIINLGSSNEEITIYNLTKKINQKMKQCSAEKHYVGEQTISDIIKELEKIGCLTLKYKEITKTGKEKKIYKLNNDSLKIFKIYKNNYQTIHKIIRMLNELNFNSDEEDSATVVIQILLNYINYKSKPR